MLINLLFVKKRMLESAFIVEKNLRFVNSSESLSPVPTGRRGEGAEFVVKIFSENLN